MTISSLSPSSGDVLPTADCPRPVSGSLRADSEHGNGRPWRARRLCREGGRGPRGKAWGPAAGQANTRGRGPGGKAAAARQGPCSAKGATSARAVLARPRSESTSGTGVWPAGLGRAWPPETPGTESARLGSRERGGHPLPSDDTRQREGDPPEGFGGRPAGQNETNGPHEAQGQLKRNGIWLLTWPVSPPAAGPCGPRSLFHSGTRELPKPGQSLTWEAGPWSVYLRKKQLSKQNKNPDCEEGFSSLVLSPVSCFCKHAGPLSA